MFGLGGSESFDMIRSFGESVLVLRLVIFRSGGVILVESEVDLLTPFFKYYIYYNYNIAKIKIKKNLVLMNHLSYF